MLIDSRNLHIKEYKSVIAVENLRFLYKYEFISFVALPTNWWTKKIECIGGIWTNKIRPLSQSSTDGRTCIIKLNYLR